MPSSEIASGDIKQDREQRNEDLAAARNPRIMVTGTSSPAESQKGTAEACGTNVSALVAKSKKAASTLWTLLHAKVRLTFSLL
jgi:hypothetical protein